MSRITRNLSIILRAERMMAQRRLSLLQRRIGMLALAGIVLCLGLVMLDVAAYLGLSWLMPRPLAALLVGLSNVALAGGLALIAAHEDNDPAMDSMSEVRDLAFEDLESEVQDMMTEGRAAIDDVRRMARDPLGAVAPGLVTAMVKLASKSAETSDTPPEDTT